MNSGVFSDHYLATSYQSGRSVGGVMYNSGNGDDDSGRVHIPRSMGSHNSHRNDANDNYDKSAGPSRLATLDLDGSVQSGFSGFRDALLDAAEPIDSSVTGGGYSGGVGGTGLAVRSRPTSIIGSGENVGGSRTGLSRSRPSRSGNDRRVDGTDEERRALRGDDSDDNFNIAATESDNLRNINPPDDDDGENKFQRPPLGNGYVVKPPLYPNGRNN